MIRNPLKVLSILAAVLLMLPFMGGYALAQARVPAEWELHSATWMQWPGKREAAMRDDFVSIIDIVQAFEPMHLVAGSQADMAEAKELLTQIGIPDKFITWHVMPLDNAWMRDNGPVYVSDGKKTWLQNWKFNAWGGNWGPEVGYENDDQVPLRVGEYLDMRIEDRQDYVLERGNLEVNGAGTAMLNWDCQDQRNPGLSQAQHEAILKRALGLSRIIWAHGHDPADLTTGHIDGIARFIDKDTVAITEYGTETEEQLAADLKQAGLEVVRYPGDINWLVGNGFVLARSLGDPLDRLLKSLLRAMFPGRDVYMIQADAIADAGGGIHCVTNDQPQAQKN